MCTRLRGLAGTVVLVCAAANLPAQTSNEPRRIDASHRPIVERLQPDDRHVTITRTIIVEPVEVVGKSFVATIVDFNSIIFTGRVVRKQAAFIDLRNSGGALFTVVPMAEANWIGSSLTMQIERVVRTTEELPLTGDARLAFVVDYDGTATVKGARVDAETPHLWPIEEGKRYLVTGNVTELGRDRTRTFVPTGMWLEPREGAPLRGPSRTPSTPDRLRQETVPTFERDAPSDTTIYAVTDRLEEEVGRRKANRPR